MNVLEFWTPVYLIKVIFLFGATLSGIVAVALIISALPKAISMKSVDELKTKLGERKMELYQQKNNLENFAQTISHNLRAPLASMTSLIEIYSLKKTPEEKNEILEKFAHVMDRLNRSIDSMSEVVNWQLDNKESEKVEIRSLFNGVRTTLMTQARRANAEIIYSQNKKEIFIFYPKLYLESVFLNLLSNSLKYRDRSRDCIIKIDAKKSKTGVSLLFKDNGIGMDLDLYGHKVFQLHQTFHDNGDARGIGLYLVKQHIAQLGGIIRIKSQIGVGTEFRIFLKDQRHRQESTKDTDRSFEEGLR